MSRDRLLKGFEVELFTGRRDGRNVGIAAAAQRELEGFLQTILYAKKFNFQNIL